LVVLSGSVKDLNFKFVYKIPFLPLLFVSNFIPIQQLRNILEALLYLESCVMIFSGLFLLLNVLLAACRFEGGCDTFNCFV
jgi:hypothetical protein